MNPTDLDDPEAARWALAAQEELLDAVHALLLSQILRREERIAVLRQELHDARNQIPPTMRLIGESEPGGGTI
jgi:hypothetical protein